MHRKTRNPRIAFVPSDRVTALVGRLSELSGDSRASICAQLLDDVSPVIEQQLEALQALHAMPERAREHLERLAAAAHQDIEQALLKLDAPDRRRRHYRERERNARATR